MRFILHNQAASDLVFEWWPKGQYAICARMVNHPDSFNPGEFDWDDFRGCLELLLESKESEGVENERYKAVLTVAAPLTQGGQLPLWASAILRETCGLLWGVAHWQLGERCFEGIEFDALLAKDKENCSTLIKNVKKDVGYRGQGPWRPRMAGIA